MSHVDLRCDLGGVCCFEHFIASAAAFRGRLPFGMLQAVQFAGKAGSGFTNF